MLSVLTSRGTGCTFAPTMTWTTSFREAYLGRFECGTEAFEKDLLRRGLHRRALPFVWAVRTLAPGFFELELRTARYLGNARSSEEFRAELDSYRSEYRRHGGVLRNVCGVRLSGRRLMDVLTDVSPESGK